LIFFDAGEISHPEFGSLVGDDAICRIIRGCHDASDGVCKFVYGESATPRTGGSKCW
jgi:hypothetical protein